MDVKIRVCLPRKYDRFMLLIDNNLLLPGAKLHTCILINIYPSKFVSLIYSTASDHPVDG
jgi:hypothetical protein